MTKAQWMNGLLLNTAALLLGALLPFAFAPYEIYPLAVIIPALMLLLWLGATSPKSAFWLGFLFGYGFFAAGVSWVYISIHEFGDVSIPFSIFITASMMAILAVYPALLGYLLNRFFPNQNNFKILCAFPALWVFLEWMRSLLLSGFAWFLLGYSQTNSPLKGYAPILSVYGVSLATILTSALLVIILLKLKQKHYKQTYFAAFAIVIIWTVGGLLSLIPWTKPQHAPVSVALVQGAIPQQIKWSRESLVFSMERYRDMTEPLWGKNQIIIWPETAIPMALQDASYFIDMMNEKALASNTALILGIPIYIPEENGYQNAVITLGKYQDTYAKRHLVPFGEYVPFSKWLFPILNFMNIPTSEIVGPVEKEKKTKGPLRIGDLKIAASVCYEITFPEEIYFNDKTIGLLLTVNNDAWFGKSNAQAQHLQMAKMRAIELQRPVIMVSNDGITAIIAPDGSIDAALPPYEASVLETKVQAMSGLTPWMKNGIDPMLFILTIMFGIAIFNERGLKVKERAPAKVLQEEKTNY